MDLHQLRIELIDAYRTDAVTGFNLAVDELSERLLHLDTAHAQSLADLMSQGPDDLRQRRSQLEADSYDAARALVELAEQRTHILQDLADTLPADRPAIVERLEKETLKTGALLAKAKGRPEAWPLYEKNPAAIRHQFDAEVRNCPAVLAIAAELHDFDATLLAIRSMIRESPALEAAAAAELETAARRILDQPRPPHTATPAFSRNRVAYL